MSADTKAKDVATAAAVAPAAAAATGVVAATGAATGASGAAAGAAAGAAVGAVAKAEETYNCTACGRAIFKASDLIKTAPLWDLGEYKAATHWIRAAIDLDALRRYDCSLHEGWYCCRFMVMRMTRDKFGTGRTLLVYADSVDTATALAAKPKAAKAASGAAAHKGQIKLTATDHDAVLNSEQNKGKLCWVKYGAIWCPPCRLMDSVIATAVAEGRVDPQCVTFFEVDVDEQKALAAQWHNDGIPFCVFYFDGKQIALDADSDPHDRVVDGGICGGMGSKELVALANRLYAAAKAGKTLVSLT